VAGLAVDYIGYVLHRIMRWGDSSQSGHTVSMTVEN
jgi:hypothetical protein